MAALFADSDNGYAPEFIAVHWIRSLRFMFKLVSRNLGHSTYTSMDIFERNP